MRKRCGIVSAALLAMLVAGPAARAQTAAGPGPAIGPTISVTGEGSVSRAPDMATIRLGVAAEGQTAEAALAQASAQLDGVLKRLAAEGIAPRDIQSTGLNLSPRWDNPQAGSTRPPRIVGFEAEGSIGVKVRALDHLGTVLDAVVKDGANRLSGLDFGLAEPGPARDEARKAAVADAIHRAELYAAAAGVKLGAVQQISDESGSPPVPMMKAAPMAFAAAAPVPVAAGEMEVTAEVQMVFAIDR